MLGEADRVIAEVVGELRLAGEVVQHLIVKTVVEPDAAAFDLRLVADRREIEERDFHASLIARRRAAPTLWRDASAHQAFCARGLGAHRIARYTSPPRN